MGHSHIENLYKDQKILMFKECYALEKIHGTSAHITYRREVPHNKVSYFAGEASHTNFKNLFYGDTLEKNLSDLGHLKVKVLGEAYGGQIQGMKETYGPDLKFIGFDVQIDDMYLNVPNAEDVCNKLGIEFVAYEKISTDLAVIDKERDRPSRQAVRNGIKEEKIAEGVVLRPLIELRANDDRRIIAKHKREEFIETATKRDTSVDPSRLAILEEAESIAREWVTDMRMRHVLGALKSSQGRSMVVGDTKLVIDAMVEDVRREAAGEIKESKEAIKAISTSAGKLFSKILREEKAA